MRGGKMKNSNLLIKYRNKLVIASYILGVLFFIFAISFMTEYKWFRFGELSGSPLPKQFYLELQNNNNIFFYLSLVLVILAFLLYRFNLGKKDKGSFIIEITYKLYLGCLLVFSIISIVILINALTKFNDIISLEEVQELFWELQVDFEPTATTFIIGIVLFVLAILVAVISLISQFLKIDSKEFILVKER